MNPQTIPTSSRKFITSTGPIDGLVLDSIRKNLRGQSVDMSKLNAYAIANGATHNPLLTPYPPKIPTVFIVKGQSALNAIVRSFTDAFRRTLPLYFSISIVPYSVFNLRRAVTQPLSTLWHATLGFVSMLLWLCSTVPAVPVSSDFITTWHVGSKQMIGIADTFEESIAACSSPLLPFLLSQSV